MIDRRDFVTAALAAAAVLRSRRAMAVPDADPLARICEAVIPTTDTPGAIEARVPEFIRLLLDSWHTPDERAALLGNLGALQRMIGPFSGHDLDRRIADALRDCHSGAAGERMQAFFRELQSLIVFGYYTSEVGATQELRYNPVPGTFDGSIDYTEVGRLWSS